jgi:hypothetical protein
MAVRADSAAGRPRTTEADETSTDELAGCIRVMIAPTIQRRIANDDAPIVAEFIVFEEVAECQGSAARAENPVVERLQPVRRDDHRLPNRRGPTDARLSRAP